MKKYEVSDGVMIYYLPQELDHYAAEKMKKKTDHIFDEEEIKVLIFDFGKTLFMDSSGIGLLTGRFRKVHDKGGMVYVLNVNNTIDKVLNMSGIYRIISKCDTKDDIINEMIKGGYYE
ncbi:MAG: STAS domain-containing protein [Lachnospiraceae bacterium]|nr:STAS domain-containing protein [Lachnospiraceae bacterium]